MLTEIRLATVADAAAIHAIYAPIVEATVISFELAPPSVDEIAERIQTTLARFPWLVCEIHSHVAGYAYAGPHHTRAAYQWSANVSVYVHNEWRGRRIGSALYRALLPILAAQGYYAAYAGIALPNPGSVRLHESVGFTPIGVYHAVGYKHGAWHDVGWWECNLQPRASDPAPPVSYHALCDTPQWQDFFTTAASNICV